MIAAIKYPSSGTNNLKNPDQSNFASLFTSSLSKWSSLDLITFVLQCATGQCFIAMVTQPHIPESPKSHFEEFWEVFFDDEFNAVLKCVLNFILHVSKFLPTAKFWLHLLRILLKD